jgi:hypothetical protein
MNLQLIRFAYTPMGTFGKLLFDEFSCFTVELPWRDNRPRVSCIPCGTYPLKRCMFRSRYETFEILEVPNRWLIKIHIANAMDDLLGCVGLGYRLGCVRGLWAVQRSRAAFTDFMDMLESEDSGSIRVAFDNEGPDAPRK